LALRQTSSENRAQGGKFNPEREQQKLSILTELISKYEVGKQND